MTRKAMYFLGVGIMSGFSAAIAAATDRPERIVFTMSIIMAVHLVIIAPLCISSKEDAQ